MEYEKTLSNEGTGVLPHLGNLIARKIKEKGVQKNTIARKMGVYPQSINRYIQCESLQFTILWELGLALEYNFLADLMESLPSKVLHSTQSKFQDIILAQAEEIRDLKKEIEIYKGILKG